MKTQGTFRRRPLEVEAIQWNGGNLADIRTWCQERGDFPAECASLVESARELRLWVEKSKSYCYLQEGGWVVGESDGIGFYPCTNRQFQDSYEET